MAGLNIPDTLGSKGPTNPDCKALHTSWVIPFAPAPYFMFHVALCGSGSRICTQNGNPGKWTHGLNLWSHGLILTHSHMIPPQATARPGQHLAPCPTYATSPWALLKGLRAAWYQNSGSFWSRFRFGLCRGSVLAGAGPTGSKREIALESNQRHFKLGIVKCGSRQGFLRENDKMPATLLAPVQLQLLFLPPQHLFPCSARAFGF